MQVYLIPEDFLADVPDSGSRNKLVQNVVPKVAEESGRQAKAKAHMKGAGEIYAEITRNLLNSLSGDWNNYYFVILPAWAQLPLTFFEALPWYYTLFNIQRKDLLQKHNTLQKICNVMSLFRTDFEPFNIIGYKHDCSIFNALPSLKKSVYKNEVMWHSFYSTTMWWIWH